MQRPGVKLFKKGTDEMIITENLTKNFSDMVALNSISCTINQGSVYGIVGSNGSGKSTFLRLLAGIYRPDGGRATLDGEDIYENPDAKKRIVYVSDELYYPAGATMERCADMYSSLYKGFDRDLCRRLAGDLNLKLNKSISTFSKGMRRQAITVMAIATRPDYLFFDETFDGLDPVMRSYIKRIVIEDVMDRGATAIMTSHSLRELEDTCDQLALLHKGGLVFESDIEELRTTRYKVQIAFDHPYDKDMFEGIDLVSFTKRGSVSNLIVKGDRDETVEKLRGMSPILLEVLPLTLEEVFTYEMEALGYSFVLD